MALDLRQRIAFREGHFVRGLRLAGRASAAYESMGWASRRCELAFALAVRHINARNDPERAGMVLREAADCVGIVPSLAAEYQYLNARVADMQGRWRDADAGYRQARRFAERLQRREDALGYLSSHYVLADALHDDAAVQEIEFEIERLSRDGRFDLCTYAAVWTNIGWIRLMRRQRGWDAPDPRPLFERARLAYEGGTRCKSRRDAENTRINLALAELQVGRHAVALTLLATIDPGRLDHDEAQWFHIAAIEAHLSVGDIERAAVDVAKLQELTARKYEPEGAMHAAYHQGLLLEARGQPERASAAYAAADAARDQFLLPLGFGSAGERAAADWDLALVRTLTLSLAAERRFAALCVVRAARRRTLRASELLVNLPPARQAALRQQFLEIREASHRDRGDDRLLSVMTRRERHELRRGLDQLARSVLNDTPAGDDRLAPSCSELRVPELGELQLFYHSVGEGLVMFAVDSQGIKVRWATLPRTSGPAILADIMLAPFDDALRRAKMVRVYADGLTSTIDVHALPWRDRPLLVSVPVAYATDVVRPDSPRRGTTATLVMADPDLGLRLAKEEAGAILAEWRRLGLAASYLGAGEGRQSVLGRLADSHLFHFIGHAERSAHVTTGRDGWNTELQLADRSSVGVDDVLAALPSAPPVVILSACETGLVDPRSPGGGLSLAGALVLRGAAVVIATTRPVHDVEASALMTELYRQARTPADLLDPGLLSRAQTMLLAGGNCDARADICAFRAWVP